MWTIRTSRVARASIPRKSAPQTGCRRNFLNGADARLTKPLLVSFNQSTVSVYWVAMGVALIAFVLTLFFRTPPLRQKSALQESADAERQPEPIALG
ncbi:hypothetical protein ACIGEP_10375 [Microbacterium sp. NPDC077663]|uniref:hypothetical protein n=1 Tax=Microbacterium sp. NPDC077663 TaxID=3364189 RepID=UPI0037CB3647